MKPGSVEHAGRRGVVRIGLRQALVLLLASLSGLAMFLWPLLLSPPEETSHVSDAPLVFVLILPVVLMVILAEVRGGGIDTKSLAMLGVLSAIGAALRPMGAGVAGIETVFFLLVLAGRVYGPGFGFVLGNTTLFASALITAGVGPWLPFQMLASGWVGMGAGLLPRRVTGRWEIAMLALYGALSALVFGFLMNIWYWPYAIGADTQLSYVAGDAVSANLGRFFLFSLSSSTLGWDIGRAITNVVAITVLGPTILGVLWRSVRRAAFGAPVSFEAVVSDDRARPVPREPVGAAAIVPGPGTGIPVTPTGSDDLPSSPPPEDLPSPLPPVSLPRRKVDPSGVQ